MIRENTPHGFKREYEVNKKDRRASKGASSKEQEKRRLAKKIRKIRK